MGWKDLLQQPEERIVAPWVGGRTLQTQDRTFELTMLPPHPGWHEFIVNGRKAGWTQEVMPKPAVFTHFMIGYLIGDRFIFDDVKIDLDPAALVKNTYEVKMVEDGLMPFTRVMVGRIHDSAPLIFGQVEFPMGPEPEVLTALEDRKENLDHIKDLPPALEVAYRFEVQRIAEVERRRREARERREAEERQRLIREQLGDGELRRQMAAENFDEAAKAALAVGGAEYLSSRRSNNRGEMVVRFRFADRRFECVCDIRMNIIDSGICLTAHYNDPDFDGGTRGDTMLTLESLPAVIQQAIDENRLVIWRDLDE
jgi:hypothetical protein